MNAHVNAYEFYRQFHGHPTLSLEVIRSHFLANDTQTIFLAGDSSLDNKYWLLTADVENAPEICANECWVSAPRQLSEVLQPAKSVQDVAYWINTLAADRFGAINCAVEATTLEERATNLRAQDIFIQDNITAQDILVVSVGGNDIALGPTPVTVFCMLLLLWTPMWLISAGIAPGLGHFVNMFRDKVQRYLKRLTNVCSPKLVLVCMIYYPDERDQPTSWANQLLIWMGYNSNPSKLQYIIETVYRKATCQIKLPNTEVLPVPLFEVLDGKSFEDYRERVEPSAQGGKKIARLLLEICRSAQQHSIDPLKTFTY